MPLRRPVSNQLIRLGDPEYGDRKAAVSAAAENSPDAPGLRGRQAPLAEAFLTPAIEEMLLGGRRARVAVA